MAEPLIQIQGLSKVYGDVTALAPCHATIDQGKLFGLLGPNGSGKTTMIRMLMGMIKPSEGTALINGLDCYSQSVAIHRFTAYLPAEAKLFPTMRGKQVLEFFCESHPDGNLSRSLEIADQLQVDISRRAAFCSTGMRQKLALASVLGMRSDLIILDEPTENLDPTARQTLLSILKEVNNLGTTVLFSSHVLSEIEQITDQVMFLQKGRIEEIVAMEDLQHIHRLQVKWNECAPTLPGELMSLVQTDRSLQDESISVWHVEQSLPDLLKWLANQPVQSIQIQPMGLQTKFDRIYGTKRIK